MMRPGKQVDDWALLIVWLFVLALFLGVILLGGRV